MYAGCLEDALQPNSRLIEANNMLNLAVGFISSFLTAWLIVRYAGLSGDLMLDHNLGGIQKNHARPVPRVGGVGVCFATFMTFSIGAFFGSNPRSDSMLLLACASPVFISGVTEDLTKRVSPRVRLLCAMVSALAGVAVMHAVVHRTDVPLIDYALTVPAVAIGVTVLAVAGLTNALNIIDGFNGLASVVSILIFGSIGYVAHDVGDWFVMSVSLTAIGAIGGFLIWNYPVASIFLGDGGAYFIGFLIAELLVLLTLRHPNVCASYALVVIIYPVFETLFTIYRRLARGTPIGEPDRIHLHTLIFLRVVRKSGDVEDSRQIARRNARTAPYLWVLSLIGIVPATFFWHSQAVLLIAAFCFVVSYLWLYTSIVRFKTPRWLVRRRRRVIAGAVTEQTRHH
jgi:UDP-N-acetylmuramyl pentapeptide phosphotransferase/UDP-N-acetylglucosamine-1-phosphate transferase